MPYLELTDELEKLLGLTGSKGEDVMAMPPRKKTTTPTQNLICVAPDVFVDPTEVQSVEREIVQEYRSTSPSDGHNVKTFDGSRIILKNGRKVYVNGHLPQAILKRLGIQYIIPRDVREMGYRMLTAETGGESAATQKQVHIQNPYPVFEISPTPIIPFVPEPVLTGPKLSRTEAAAILRKANAEAAKASRPA